MLIKRCKIEHKTRYIFSCDVCNANIIRAKKTRKHDIDVCSIECLKSVGLEETSDEYRSLLGVLNRRNTMLRRYGGPGTFGSTLDTNARNTMFERYGTSFAAQNDEVMNKIKETNVKRCGHENNIHGSSCDFVTPFKDPNVQAKARDSIHNRFGMNCAANSMSVVFDRHARYLSAYKTKRSLGLLAESSQERKLSSCLAMIWGEKSIEKHVIVNGWSIDLMIKPIETYVQVDGIYWHGLDRDISTIGQSERSIDKKIYEKFLRDREQDHWFLENNLRLVRITDVEINEHTNDLMIILCKYQLLPNS